MNFVILLLIGLGFAWCVAGYQAASLELKSWGPVKLSLKAILTLCPLILLGPFVAHLADNLNSKRLQPKPLPLLPPQIPPGSITGSVQVEMLWDWHEKGTLFTLEDLTDNPKIGRVAQALMACDPCIIKTTALDANTKHSVPQLLTLASDLSSKSKYLYTDKPLTWYLEHPEFWLALHKQDPGITKILLHMQDPTLRDTMLNHLALNLLSSEPITSGTRLCFPRTVRQAPWMSSM